jgi:hypothetical protein
MLVYAKRAAPKQPKKRSRAGKNLLFPAMPAGTDDDPPEKDAYTGKNLLLGFGCHRMLIGLQQRKGTIHFKRKKPRHPFNNSDRDRRRRNATRHDRNAIAAPNGHSNANTRL